MLDTKVTAVIVNATEQGLTMKAGNRQCYVKLTSIKVGGEFEMQIDVNWTYQEFMVQDKSHSHHPLFLNSDDCCDYERITIQENMDGSLNVQRDLHNHFRSNDSAIKDESSGILLSSWKSWLYRFMHV